MTCPAGIAKLVTTWWFYILLLAIHDKHNNILDTGVVLEWFKHCFIDFGCAQFGHPNLRFVHNSVSKKYLKNVNSL